MNLFTGFVHFLIRGGPAMFALLGCSILVVAIIFERVVFHYRQHVDANALMEAIGQRVAAGDISGAVAVCDRTKGALPKILKAGLLHNSKGPPEITAALLTAAHKFMRGFDQNLPTLGTIAVIAPFIGLFGTVLGIIHAFDAIALKGNSSPAIVAAGVSEALITTAAGLFVAVTSVIFFNYFKNQSRLSREEALLAADELVELLRG